MKSNRIRHQGVVESIEDGCMRVRIEQTSACAGCKISSHCSASEQKEKMIDVYDKSSIMRHAIGDHVVVATSMSTGMRAVVLGFAVPFVVLVGALLLALQLTPDEGMAALIALGALIPYYCVLYLLRHRLRSQFSFMVED